MSYAVSLLWIKSWQTSALGSRTLLPELSISTLFQNFIFDLYLSESIKIVSSFSPLTLVDVGIWRVCCLSEIGVIGKYLPPAGDEPGISLRLITVRYGDSLPRSISIWILALFLNFSLNSFMEVSVHSYWSFLCLFWDSSFSCSLPLSGLSSVLWFSCYLGVYALEEESICSSASCKVPGIHSVWFMNFSISGLWVWI